MAVPGNSEPPVPPFQLAAIVNPARQQGWLQFIGFLSPTHLEIFPGSQMWAPGSGEHLGNEPLHLSKTKPNFEWSFIMCKLPNLPLTVFLYESLGLIKLAYSVLWIIVLSASLPSFRWMTTGSSPRHPCIPASLFFEFSQYSSGLSVRRVSLCYFVCVCSSFPDGVPSTESLWLIFVRPFLSIQ